MSIEAMKQALDALEEINKLSIGESAICLPAEIDAAMDALRQAIEQAEQAQPVAWYDPEVMNEDRGISWTHGQFHTAPLYAVPPPRQPLTDEEIFEVHKRVDSMQYLTFARAIEAAHGVGEKAWVGLNEYERKFLEASNSQFYVVHHDNKNDISYAATKVDWNSLFEAIEAKLKERNG
jgi:hypothetical protein